jgi:acetoin utilization deacetylase AcuC-like enzyme
MDYVLYAVMLLFLFLFTAQFGPELVLVSAGYDSALGDEKVVSLILWK